MHANNPTSPFPAASLCILVMCLIFHALLSSLAKFFYYKLRRVLLCILPLSAVVWLGMQVPL